MKTLIFLLLAALPVHAEKLLSEDSWSNACGPWIGDNSGYLTSVANIGVAPSGCNLCKEESKILSKPDWLKAIRDGLPLGFEPSLKNSKFIELKSFEEFEQLIKKNGGIVQVAAKENFDKFFSTAAENPVMYYAQKGKRLFVLAGTSNGKTVGFAVSEYKGR